METQQEKNHMQVAEIQLSYKTNVKPSDRPKISSSMDAYNIFKHAIKDKIEFVGQFRVLLIFP